MQREHVDDRQQFRQGQKGYRRVRHPLSAGVDNLRADALQHRHEYSLHFGRHLANGVRSPPRCVREPRNPQRSPDFGSGRVRINSAGAPRAGLLPPLLPMLRRASPLAQHRRARPTAAMTIRNATTGLNGTNAPMTVPTAQSEHCSYGCSAVIACSAASGDRR
jgi:hypothetical protein